MIISVPMQYSLEEALSKDLDIPANVDIEPHLQSYIRGGYLLHGSRLRLEGTIKPSTRGYFSLLGVPYVLASSSIPVALVNALFLPYSTKLEYPKQRTTSPSDFKLTIHKAQPHTIGEFGFIYLLKATNLRQQGAVWEYRSLEEVPIASRITVHLEQYNYPWSLCDCEGHHHSSRAVQMANLSRKTL